MGRIRINATPLRCRGSTLRSKEIGSASHDVAIAVKVKSTAVFRAPMSRPMNCGTGGLVAVAHGVRRPTLCLIAINQPVQRAGALDSPKKTTEINVSLSAGARFRMTNMV